MEKTIEQIIALSKNPHYVLSETEVKRLREYQKKNLNENHMNKNRVQTHSRSIQKHDTVIKE